MTLIETLDDGVVIDWADQKRLDTRAMAWSDFDGGPQGSKIKILAADEGRVRVCLLWTPPSEDRAPLRRVHRGPRQFSLVLSGEAEGVEYPSAEGPGATVVYRSGFFTDRSPGSVYSVGASPIGTTSLVWRLDGDGNVPAEFEVLDDRPQAAAERSLQADSDGLLLDAGGVRVLDTRNMPWARFAGLERGKVKLLTHDQDGNPGAFLVWIPPGEIVEGWALPHRHYHRSIQENSFMLAGELPHWEYENKEQQAGARLIVRPGYFLDRSPGSIHGLEPGLTSATGCILLQWREGVGNWANEPEFADETIEVPYAQAGAGS